ncbi:hypothetical Protein YC6258_04176 [Gynuella sunshinyii YC6258]|uniref:Uncharacterized protein n=1 Tax=Gynuella sunshinyii YC6258 TaxID=1445510 RepID=A0A0C5VNE2_9GAMM|nr:hypothetical Protein YC6258_04176 [Gynuella sunshinyii YC6258]
MLFPKYPPNNKAFSNQSVIGLAERQLNRVYGEVEAVKLLR